MTPSQVIVALGSNLGNSSAILLQAIDQLQSWSTSPVRASSIWVTDPVDCPPNSPPFHNAVASLAPLPGETPETLLPKLLQLETRFGPRPRHLPNEPRPLDLDLILFGREERNSPQLTLPHPRAIHRRFVLGPLAEIAPDLLFPGQQLTVRQLLDTLSR
jgi:2-amino-4-hydroxy-6-hydroxymethyldihydropteridine diphosphokinase